MALSLVQSTTSNNASVTSQTFVMSSAPAVGNALVVSFAIGSTTSGIVPTISDSNSNTWSQLGTIYAPTLSSGEFTYQGIYVCVNNANVSNTITMRTSVSSDIAGIAMEITGNNSTALMLDTPGILTKQGGNATVAASTTLLTLSPVTVGAFVFGNLLTLTGAPTTVAAPWTRIASTSVSYNSFNHVDQVEWQIAKAASSLNVAWSSAFTPTGGYALIATSLVALNITLVQTVKDFDAGGANGTFTSLAGAYGSNNTLGNLLVLGLSAGQNASGAQVDPVSVADTAGNTWVKAFREANATGATNPGCEWVYYVAGCKAGANTVTVTFAASSQNFISFNIYEFKSTTAGTWTVDQSAGATSASTVSITPIKQPSVAVAVTSNWTSQPTGTNAAWCIGTNPSAIFTGTAYTVAWSTAAIAPGFTTNVTSSDAAVASVNFYVAASGGTTINYPFTENDNYIVQVWQAVGY